jgi:hypothetical protein
VGLLVGCCAGGKMGIAIVGQMRNNFVDAGARKDVLIDLCAMFWQKGAPTLDLENNWEIAFPNE